MKSICLEFSVWNWQHRTAIRADKKYAFLFSILEEVSYHPSTMEDQGHTTLRTPAIPLPDGLETTKRLKWLLMPPRGCGDRCAPFYEPFAFANFVETDSPSDKGVIANAMALAKLVPDDYKELDQMDRQEHLAHIKEHGYTRLQPLKFYNP
jgi:hypothetical protein